MTPMEHSEIKEGDTGEKEKKSVNVNKCLNIF